MSTIKILVKLKVENVKKLTKNLSFCKFVLKILIEKSEAKMFDLKAAIAFLSDQIKILDFSGVSTF